MAVIQLAPRFLISSRREHSLLFAEALMYRFSFVCWKSSRCAGSNFIDSLKPCSIVSAASTPGELTHLNTPPRGRAKRPTGECRQVT